MTLKLFIVWVIYRMKTLEHSMLSFYLILESLTRFERVLIYFSFGQFDDTKISFTHNISR